MTKRSIRGTVCLMLMLVGASCRLNEGRNDDDTELLAAAALALARSPGGFRIPDSNQADCYDAAGIQRSCAGTGEDGEYRDSPAPYSLSIGDGGLTIAEASSGLTWMRCEVGKFWNGSTCAGGSSITYPVNSAVHVCESLTLGGRSWRLPSLREAALLPDLSVTGIVALSAAFFPVVAAPSSPYWTATPQATGTGYANNYLAIQSDFRTMLQAITGNLAARCVAGLRTPSPVYSDRGDGSVAGP